VGWTLAAGSRVISYPGLNPPALDWPFGQALELNLNWADRSVWRPITTQASSGLVVNGSTASFASGGDWALLRMLEQFKPRLVPSTDPADPNRVLMELVVPVIRVDTAAASAAPSQAVMYLGLNLAANDPKAPTPAPVSWPGPFARTAPAAPAIPTATSSTSR